tara:strand:- start:67 stop:390 length:324 start_codon:yes stop_codon:yes gene_type:complete
MTLENPAIAAMDKFLDETAEEENYEMLVEHCLDKLMCGKRIVAKVNGFIRPTFISLDDLTDEFHEFTLMVLRGNVEEAKAFLKDQIENPLRDQIETWYDEILQAENL